MKCPNCKKGELVQNISYRTNGWGTKYFKKYAFFCPNCDYEKEKELEISFSDYNAEITAKHRGKDIDSEVSLNIKTKEK